MKRSHGYRGQNDRSSTNAGVHHYQPTNQSRDEEKLLNTGSRMDMFLNVCDVFEKVLDDVEIDSCSKQVHDKLLSIQHAIQQKVKPFKLTQFGSYGDLSSSRSLASSVSSICSVTSVPPLSLEDDLIFKQFFRKVNCPFCSESQADKINLIKHLNSCDPFINKTFEKLNFIPYSVFQILPNNSFKCNVCPNSVQRNIKSNFVHAGDSHHISAYNSLAVKKTFTEFFYCSSCKVLVPNNFTQLNIHMKSEVHASKCLKAVKVDSYLNKNIHCLYMKCKKFKCLICLLQSLFSTPEQVIHHFNDSRHLKALKQKHLSLGMIFCEFCSVDVHSVELLSHLTSNEHMFQEKIANFQETFELCLYCGVFCKNLMELAAHMKANCQEINELKKEHPECNKVNEVRKQSTELEKSDGMMKQKSDNDKKIEGGAKKRNIIIVKNNTDMPKLFVYFKAFGEIVAVEMFREKNVLIEFKEKRSVDEILMVRDIIRMNDIKLEVTTDEELKSEKKVQPKKKNRERRVSFQNPSDDPSASECEKENEKVDSSDGDDLVNDIFNVEIEDSQLRELFQSVSGHLVNSTQKFNSDIQKNILQDCSLTFDGYKCTLVGFAGSGLSFSVESISLYLLSNSLHEDELFILSRKLLDNFTWTDVTYHDLEPVPYVRAIHRSTKTVCKITKRESTKILTDILCYFQNGNDVVKPFCLMIRFWLSVHELKIREFEYVIMSLLIFFLVNQEVVKPFPNMDIQSLKEAFVFEELINEKYKLNKDTTKNEDKRTFSVHELFLKFLRFLIRFDFNKHAICAPIKHPIPRDWKLQRHIIEIKRINQQNNSAMFIWDPLVQVNLAQNVSENDLKSLLDTAMGKIFK